MNKGKILLSATVASMIVTGAVLAINGALKGSLKSSFVFATDGAVWHHYPAVAPTETTHGSKEFWASSVDGCTTHTFTDPGVECVEHDFSKYDSFASLSRDDDRYVWCLNEQWGITPVFGEKTVTYGLYPQTVVDDESLITALNGLSETSGYYFYKNAYYAKASAAVESYLDCTFDNGTKIVKGTPYWFKCEPITWNVLSNTDGVRYILSSVLLDAKCYYNGTGYRGIDDEGNIKPYDDKGDIIYPNNYEHSDIRSWLKTDFYNSAFALHDSYIQTTTVDSSASTTSSDDNPYACGSTQDNVFLPSYQDYKKSAYGFLNSEDETNTRYCKTTDWARARGAYCDCDTDSSYRYNGFYWTRSPYSSSSSPNNYDDVRVWYVNTDGQLSYSDCYYPNYGVRPAISFKIA